LQSPSGRFGKHAHFSVEPITHKTLNFAFNQGNIVAYYKFNNSSSLGLDSNPSSTKYNLTPTIVGGTGGYDTSISVEGASFQATNDGDRLEGDFPLKTIYDNSTTGISISLWFYKKLATYDNPYNTSVYRFFNPSNPLLVIMFYTAHHSNTYKNGFSIQYGVSGEVYAGGIGSTIAFDTWYHIVFIITKSGNIKVYMNGTNLNLVAGSVEGTIRNYGSSVYPIPTSSFPNTTKLKIFNAYTDGSFSGNMDEFYVFNKELSQAEITSLYNKTYQAPINTYTLSVQSGTSIQVNNGTAQYLSGNYTISVGATQSSVLISGFSPANQTDPYPLQNGSTISIRYSMLQRITSLVNYKKDGLIKYVPASGTNPSTGSWNIIDLDTQPLTQFAGNLPANRLDNIDMSKVATGNLDWSRIASQPALSSLSGNLPLNRTDGNLPASRLDNIDMSKVATGNLHHSRVQDLYLGINNRFWRIEYAYENVITFGGIYINKFRINTNLHLNSYNEVYNYFQYFLSMSPNNLADRHMYWFGVVKMSNKVGTDSSPLTRSTSILSSDSSLWEIKETNSSSGVWWLNVWVYTTTFCESIICILH